MPEWHSYYMVIVFQVMFIWTRVWKPIALFKTFLVTGWHCLEKSQRNHQTPQISSEALCTTSAAWTNHTDLEICWQQGLLSHIWVFFDIWPLVPQDFDLKVYDGGIWWITIQTSLLFFSAFSLFFGVPREVRDLRRTLRRDIRKGIKVPLQGPYGVSLSPMRGTPFVSHLSDLYHQRCSMKR